MVYGSPLPFSTADKKTCFGVAGGSSEKDSIKFRDFIAPGMHGQ